jgi:hypothetical protein
LPIHALTPVIEVRASTHAEISNYKVATYSRNPTHSHIATIGLQDTSNTYVGYIFFYAEGYTLPPANTSGDPWLFYHINEMGFILDLLRNESPIYLTTSANAAQLSTSLEPVGEEET